MLAAAVGPRRRESLRALLGAHFAALDARRKLLGRLAWRKLLGRSLALYWGLRAPFYTAAPLGRRLACLPVLARFESRLRIDARGN